MLRAIAPTLRRQRRRSDEGEAARHRLVGRSRRSRASRRFATAGSRRPRPNADRGFISKYRAAFGATPPQLAALAYDAVSLIALLGSGKPYQRFTRAALTDPNGFSGVDGIFRFNADGTIERGLSCSRSAPAASSRQPRADDVPGKGS